MAISQRDFKQIPSSGIIPSERLPASAFAVGFTFIYTAYLDFSNPNQSFVAKLRLQVLDSSDAVKYEIEIEEHYFVILFPGLYTWNWVPQQEKITGTHADGSPMTILGGAGASFGVDPAEDSGTSTGEAIVASTFYSSLFEEPLAEGDRLKIKFHNVSAGFVVSRASLLLATELGASIGDALRDSRIGQSWFLYQDASGLRVASTRRNGGRVQTAADALVTSDKVKAAGFSRSGQTLRVWSVVGTSFRMHSSHDEGENWETTAMIETGIQALASCGDSQGAAQYIYGVASADIAASGLAKGDAAFAILKRGADGAWKMTTRGKSSGAPIKDLIRMESTLGTLRLTARAKTNDVASFAVYLSANEGKSWSETGTEVPQA